MIYLIKLIQFVQLPQRWDVIRNIIPSNTNQLIELSPFMRAFAERTNNDINATVIVYTSLCYGIQNDCFILYIYHNKSGGYKNGQ